MPKGSLRAEDSKLRQFSASLIDRLQFAQSAFKLLYERVTHRRPRPPVLKPYSNNKTWQRQLLSLSFFPPLILFCLIYGFFFALTAPYLIVQFAMPIVLLSLLVIWALPDERAAPVTLMRFLLSSYIICLILWPNYLAVALPGLPWITFIRLTGIPLAFCLCIALSISGRFRFQLGQILNSTPLVWRGLAVFVALQFLTLPVSDSIASSLNRSLIYQVNWTAIFLVSAYVFYKPGRISRYIALIGALAIPVTILSTVEFNQQHLLWDGHVPSILKIDDLDKVMKPEFRAGTGIYRAKVMFSTALGLAEYMALLTPFFLHYLMRPGKLIFRLYAAAMIVALYIAITNSGSRLGYIGMLWASLLYAFVWSFMRWRRSRSDLIAPTIFFSYPAFFVLVMGASLFVRRLHTAIWGGGAQQGSNQARMDQISMALPKVLVNPFGYGTGMSGPTMGYAEGSFVTIDNYLISIVLDYGVLGLIAYFGMFLAATAYALRFAILYGAESRDPEAHYLVPLGVALSTFVVIKIVFSQIDNHPLVFMLLGMTVALVARLTHGRKRDAGEAALPVKSS